MSQMPRTSALQLLLELSTIPVNGILVIAFYAGEMNLRDAHFLKSNLTVFGETGFFLGTTAVILALVARRWIRESSHRIAAPVLGALLSIAALVALLMSAIPFKLS